MKQHIYQKLLMSLVIVAFFGTLTSAQVLSRNQVDAKQIQTQQQTMNELKMKAKAQGLAVIPTEWIEEAKQARIERTRTKRMATTISNESLVKKTRQTESSGSAKQITTIPKRKGLDKETLQKRNSTDIRNMRMTRIKLPNGKTIVTDANNAQMVQMIIEANSN